MRVRAVRTTVVAFIAALSFTSLAAPGHAEDRTLSFKQLHTGETVTITFKRNGRYDSEGLKKINYILRDWRRNEATTIDPALVDLIWEVRKAVGSNAPVYVLSGYRSPVTNAALRSRSRGVAQNSQHTVGKALDFYLPDVPLSKLRATALKMQRGGVGYYPTSGSPFVHLDTGNPRHWPRMTRQQLATLFPDGKTVMIPSDGKPMPGYNEAVAELKRGITAQAASLSGTSRQRFVANYPRLDPSVAITEASVSRSASTSGRSGRGLFAALFESGEDGDEEAASASTEPAPAAQPVAEEQPTVVAALSLADAPLPRLKPATPAPLVAAADVPVPAARPTVLAALEPAAGVGSESGDAIALIAGASSEGAPLMTASVPPAAMTLAALPRERPLMTGADATDAIATLISDNADMTPMPDADRSTVTALAPTGPVADLPPFAATFTGSRIEPRDGPVFVAIDYRPEALKPYMDASTCLRGETFVALRHPDQNEIGGLTALTGPVVVNRFAHGPQLAYPLRKFTGPAVAPVSTRTYQMASLTAAPEGDASAAQASRAAALR